jgi:hypothetical protein
MMAGNGPINTNPVYATDETVWIRSRGDFASLSNSSEQLAFGNDGAIANGAYWTMTSNSIDFQGQGVTPQCVAWLTAPKASFPGGGRFLAVDSVGPNQIVLRVIGKALNVGQPPAPLAGLSAITFTINTFASLIEDASWDLKNRFALDENVPFRASNWLYQGAEDMFRDLRAACVLQVLVKAFQAENRSKEGDWAMKLSQLKSEYNDVLDRMQLRFGPFGNSEPPVTRFSCRFSR